MYNRYLKVKKSKPGTGNGVFTDIDIPANSPIIEIGGNIYDQSEIGSLDQDVLLQISNRLFIGSSGDSDDYLNHSCDPNSYLRVSGRRAILFSLYLIKAGMEITFDYSTTSTDTLDTWKMDCLCGSYKCRKIISGYQYLDDKLKAEYQQKGMIPLFLTDKVFRNT